jgi:protein TonB
LRPSTGDGRSDLVSAPVSAHVPAVMATARAKRKEPAASGAVTLAGATRADAPAVASAAPLPSAPAASTPVIQAERRPVEMAAAPAEPSAPHVQFNLRPVNLTSIGSVNVDSLVGSSARPKRETIGTPMAAPIGSGARPAAAADADDPPATAPRIVGRAPAPRFPDALRSRMPEGDVLVRFEIDEHGRVNVGGMVVLKSDHELFTEAVRSILPLYRFEPAHLPPPESKPVAVWVDLPFKFSAKK